MNTDLNLSALSPLVDSLPPSEVKTSLQGWLAAQEASLHPQKPTCPTIIIDVSGGVVQSAVATEPIDAIVIDYEANEDADDDNRIYPIPQSDGSTSNAWVGEANCEVDPARVAQIVQALEAADAAAAE